MMVPELVEGCFHHQEPALSLDQAAAAFIVAAAAAAAAAVLLAAFVRSVHGAGVGRGDTLDEVAVAVVAGDADGSLGEFLLDVAVGREDYAARGDEVCTHLVDVGYRLGAETETHGAKSRNGY